MSKKDSEPITVTSESHDFLDMLTHGMKNVQYKLFLLMFVLFIFLSSDVFQHRILAKFSNAMDGHQLKTWGTILQGTFLVLGMIIIDIIIKLGVV